MSQKKNYIAIVLDRSSSMERVRDATIKAFNDQIEHIKQQSHDQETRISLFTFSYGVYEDMSHVDVCNVKPLTRNSYSPSGMTALFDAVATAINKLRILSVVAGDDVSYLVIVITDGQENQSSEYSISKDGDRRIRLLLAETRETGRWTHAFMMPPGEGKDFADKFGIPIESIREWEATERGVREATVATQAGLTNYFDTRRAGGTQVAQFYHVTDMSKVDRSTIQAKLKDISHFFKVWEVPKESRIDEFVAGKTKKPYIVGSGYYQLMKKELVQTHKKVLIMEKGQPHVWGGPDARALIGLPEGADSKVTPGNHSNYDIYVQSKAPNRKLPRGTRVIYDPSFTGTQDPTWDYQTAYEEAERKRQTAGVTA